MAGKRNWLGRVYEPGKAVSEPLREEIIEMYNEGLSLTDISNDVKVTVRGVNKMINRHGGSGADVVTDDILHCIEIWKLQRPNIYAREIQNRLLLEGICDRDELLSISVINRSLNGTLGMTRRSLQVCQKNSVKNSMSAIFDIFPDTTREVYGTRVLFICPIKIRVLDRVLF